MRAVMKVTTRALKLFSVLALVSAGCVDDQTTAPLEVGDEIVDGELDLVDPPAIADDEPPPTEEIIEESDIGLDLDDPDAALDTTTQTAADTIGPAYHLFTKTGKTCRDHCISHDEYLGSYGVVFSSPFYHYNNSKIYSDYYVGQSRKQIWEQHRFKRAHVDVFCGSSGQYLYKYYGRAKRGRDVVRTWLCFAGRCRFQGDNVLSMHKGWKH